MFGRWSSNRRTPARPVPEVDRTPPVRVSATPTAEELTGHVQHLEESLRDLADFTRDRAVPSNAVINPLLVVWDAAHELDAEVSRPVEALLTAAVQRTSLGCDEVIGCIQEVRALALQETVLAQAVGL